MIFFVQMISGRVWARHRPAVGCGGDFGQIGKNLYAVGIGNVCAILAVQRRFDRVHEDFGCAIENKYIVIVIKPHVLDRGQRLFPGIFHAQSAVLCQFAKMTDGGFCQFNNVLYTLLAFVNQTSAQSEKIVSRQGQQCNRDDPQ